MGISERQRPSLSAEQGNPFPHIVDEQLRVKLEKVNERLQGDKQFTFAASIKIAKSVVDSKVAGDTMLAVRRKGLIAPTEEEAHPMDADRVRAYIALCYEAERIRTLHPTTTVKWREIAQKTIQVLGDTPFAQTIRVPDPDRRAENIFRREKKDKIETLTLKEEVDRLTSEQVELLGGVDREYLSGLVSGLGSNTSKIKQVPSEVIIALQYIESADQHTIDFAKRMKSSLPDLQTQIALVRNYFDRYPTLKSVGQLMGAIQGQIAQETSKRK